MYQTLKPGKELKPHTTPRIKAILSQLHPNTKDRFDAKWLDDNIRNKPERSLIYGKYRISYSRKIGEYHSYTIEVIDKTFEEKLESVIKKVYKDSSALNHIWEQRNDNKYKNFDFQSHAEVAISIELNYRKILFFANPMCLIYDRNGEKHLKKPDFLVIYKGKTRILEIDGEEYHRNAFEDYKRDRMFEKYGLRTTRFTADECLNNPGNVIEEFLELFDNGTSQDEKNKENIRTVEI